MIIETKFDIGQEVWFILRGEKNIQEGFIKAVFPSIRETEEDSSVRYAIIDASGYALRIPEDQIFATLEEAEQALKRLEGKDE